MKIVCAWCGADMGEKPGGEGVTHSKCEDCIQKDRDEIERRKKEKEEKDKNKKK